MDITSVITELIANPKGVRFDRLVIICVYFFGEA